MVGNLQVPHLVDRFQIFQMADILHIIDCQRDSIDFRYFLQMFIDTQSIFIHVHWFLIDFSMTPIHILWYSIHFVAIHGLPMVFLNVRSIMCWVQSMSQDVHCTDYRCCLIDDRWSSLMFNGLNSCSLIFFHVSTLEEIGTSGWFATTSDEWVGPPAVTTFASRWIGAPTCINRHKIRPIRGG